MINANPHQCAERVAGGQSVVGRLDQQSATALGPGSVYFLLVVVVVAPELEPAVLNAQHRHRPFTIERFTPRAAGHCDQRYRQPVVSDGFLEVEWRGPSGALSTLAEEAEHRFPTG
jgi:hypothetical protein